MKEKLFALAIGIPLIAGVFELATKNFSASAWAFATAFAGYFWMREREKRGEGAEVDG